MKMHYSHNSRSQFFNLRGKFNDFVFRFVMLFQHFDWSAATVYATPLLNQNLALGYRGSAAPPAPLHPAAMCGHNFLGSQIASTELRVQS